MPIATTPPSETFVPRRVYGDYVSGLLWSCVRPLGKGAAARIELFDDEAVDVQAEESGARVTLAGGESIVADKVLLATGNQAPAPLRAVGRGARASGLIAPLPGATGPKSCPTRGKRSCCSAPV